MVVGYLITIKILPIKKLRRNRQKFEIFFVKFQAPFLGRLLIYDYTYHVKLMHVQGFDSGDRHMIYTTITSLLIKKTVLFVETTKLFISNSVRVYRHIREIF